MVAVRLDLVDQILPRVLSSIVYGLMDDDDDVRAVAADTLHPMASAVVNNPMSFAHLPQILTTLWGTFVSIVRESHTDELQIFYWIWMT